MSINQRIKVLRQELKLSQAKFAKAISISNGYIASIELGTRSVNERIIKLICSEFNVREDWLIHGTGDIFENNLNSIDESILSVFKELKPEFQEYVINQINELLKIQNSTNN